MDKAYRAGQIVNVWLLGMLCGLVLYSTIRHAEAYEAEQRAEQRARPRVYRSAPRAIHRGIDIGQVACGVWRRSGP